MDELTPPNEEDCCNSGCNPCIFDVYEAKLNKLKSNQHNLKNPNVKNCISDVSYSKFKLISKETHTEDTYLMTFEYVGDPEDPDIERHLIISPGQYLIVKSPSGDFTRPYTPLPINDNASKTRFRIVVKIYEYGRMSRIFDRMKIGAESSWRGPYGEFELTYNRKYVLAIAQGTGVAPIYSVLKRALDDENFECFVKLFFCVRSVKDILLREELYAMSRCWNFSYEVFVNDTLSLEEEIKYNEVVRGYKLSEDVVLGYFDGSKDRGICQVWVCGSEDFNKAVLGYLEKAKIKDVHVF